MARFSKHFCLIALSVVLILMSSTPIFAEPEKGGTLVVINHQTPRHLVGAVQSGNATAQPSTQLFAALVRFDDNWNPLPYLAESWEFSSDGLKATFNLRKDAYFHDGEPITSEDVAFSVMTVKAHHPFRTMMAPVNRVETPDPHTAVFHLDKPHPALILSLSPALCPILPKHIYDDGQDMANHPMHQKPVGSGPFRFVEFRPGEHLILERNDNFFIEGRPYLDRIIYRYVHDPGTRVMMMERGDGDIQTLAASTQDISRAQRKGNLVISDAGYAAIGALGWIGFNLKNEILSDVRVRRAIAFAIDRDFICDNLHAGISSPATGPIVPTSPFYSPNVERYDVDLDKANALLDEAGYPKKGRDGMRMTLDIYYQPGNAEQHKLVAEYLKSQLKRIGIDLQVRSSADFPSWAQRVSNWDFDLITDSVWNWGDPVIGVDRTYICDNIRRGVIWSNTQNYCNPKVDEILGKAGKEMDMEKRKALYEEFQKIVADDLPVYWLFVNPFHSIYDNRLRNIDQSIWGPMSPLDQVYWDK